MGAYEELRDDVTAQYQSVVRQHQSAAMQEGPWVAGAIPSVSVSGSKPAWLGDRARARLACGASAGAAAALGLMAFLAEKSAGAASTAGGFAVVALLVAYLTVAGFGKVEFTVGSGADTGDAKDGEPAHPGDGRKKNTVTDPGSPTGSGARSRAPGGI